MNNQKFLLVFLMLMLGTTTLVGAVTWNDTSYINPYYFSEDNLYYYNFTVNLTNTSDFLYFYISNITSNITIVNGTLHSDYYWMPWNDTNDTGFSNSGGGFLKINATNNNETGNFSLLVSAVGTSGGVSRYFNFIINATNDPPEFTLNPLYNVSVPVLGSASKNISLVGSDEEKQYPLVYNVTFLNCSHASWSSKTDCNLTYNMSEDLNTTSTLAFSNLTYNDVGVYNLTVCSHDDVNSMPLPLYRDASYDENKSTCKNTTLNLLSSLSIDVSNCTGQNLTEGDWLNCTINVTTVGATDNVNISSDAFFSDTQYTASNSTWFYQASSENATDFVIPINISILLTKENVGNWTINFSATDGISDVYKPIYLFVNYTESNVGLDSIPNLDAVYQNTSFTVKAYDDDLLILDGSVKDEQLTYKSNTSWVVIGQVSTYATNYTTAPVSINYDNISASGDANYSVKINVTDVAGDSSERIFNIQILHDNAPEWNSNLTDPVVLNLTEGKLFDYNFSANASDIDNDTLTFYYNDLSGNFCSLNSSYFDSTTGVYNFTPVDCDVGFHNVTMIASDGKLNTTHQFVFNISNIDDKPSIVYLYINNGSNIVNGSSVSINESNTTYFYLIADDDDFLIQQRNYYNESLTVNVTTTNSTDDNVNLFNFSFVEFANPHQQSASYSASFTPNFSQVGNYTVFINITDKSGNSTNRTFFLDVKEVLSPPNLTAIDNHSVTIYDYLNFSVNATDTKDDSLGINLTYSIANLSVGSPNLSIGNITGGIEFNMSSNETYSGKWGYNVTVEDSDSLTDSKIFYLSVYGIPTLVSPNQNSVFNSTENVEGVLNFTINHSVEDNLTYEFWIDNISCSYHNSSNCSYGNLTLRKVASYYGNGSVFEWSFTPSFTDETYGNYKNLTINIYPNTTDLNYSQRKAIATNFSFKLNITHTNAPVSFNSNIGSSKANYNQNIEYDLSSYFSDADTSDSYYRQPITLSISSYSNPSHINTNGEGISNPPQNISYNNWNLILSTGYKTAFSEWLNITASDTNDSDNSTLTSAPSNSFQITFTVPTTTTIPTPISYPVTKLKLYALRIIVPHDVIISANNYIDIPFSLQNVGETDLSGINLSSQVLFNNGFSKNVKISIGTNYIPLLKIGETKNYTMRILADTSKSGRYKATLFANVTSPQFEDWGDFFIDIHKTNDTDVEQTMIFTEKLVVENPECLELTELFKRAKTEYSSGNFSGAIELAHQVSNACESAIVKNSQIKKNPNSFVRSVFYYISFATLIIFFIGFLVYIYKRVRFNKSKGDEYV